MELKWIFNRARLFTMGGVLFGASFFAGCDTFESDFSEPSVKTSGDELFVLAEGETVIDLKSLLSTNFSGRLSVTELPSYGKLQNIADGLLRYAPDKGLSRRRDSFEFTIFSSTNAILSKDTVYINIETDSTKLPCTLYPRPDYVSGFQDGRSVAIHVTANDILCGHSVNVELYQPVPGALPRHGSATVDGATVHYTPGASFTGADTLIYRISAVENPSLVAYGSVYLNGDSACAFTLADDNFRLDSLTTREVYYLDVFANDVLCDSMENYEVSVLSNPDNGTVNFTGRGFYYRPRTRPAAHNDAFIYAVGQGTNQKQARVMLTFETPTVPCAIQANADTIDIAALSTSLVYIDVLKNDQLCDSIPSLSITRQPKFGSAYVDASTKRIAYNRVVMKSDSLQYEICNGPRCSKATAYIKQQD